MRLSFDGPGVDRITNRSDRDVIESRSLAQVDIPGVISVCRIRYTLSDAQSRLAGYPLPREPRTTFNVGHIEGGTSVNAIPEKAAMDVDLRSGADAELQRLDSFFRRAVRQACDEENASERPGDPLLELKLELIGERPSGETPADSPFVELAVEATKILGIEPRLDQSSTDSNLPISLGFRDHARRRWHVRLLAHTGRVV